MHLFSLVRREFLAAFYWFAFLNDFKTAPGAECGNPNSVTENEATAVSRWQRGEVASLGQQASTCLLFTVRRSSEHLHY